MQFQSISSSYNPSMYSATKKHGVGDSLLGSFGGRHRVEQSLILMWNTGTVHECRKLRFKDCRNRGLRLCYAALSDKVRIFI